MEIRQKELEKSLSEAGNKLLTPPSIHSELLASLDLVEYLLLDVEQSPTESMKEALDPSTKALVAEELFRHSDDDIKVSVASCISEITRITAPNAPYDDDQMKEVFQLIVSSFEKLGDKSSRSYTKRVSILETIAKVRSCVVMLDLECDELIVEMFRHFFRTIRDDHDDKVLFSMETIMILVVEESEEISADLISSILDVLKKQNKETLPIACQLGEKVIDKCASKLQPYLLQAVRSSGASLSDYSKVVVNVCQAGDELVEATDGDDANKNVINADEPPKSKSKPKTLNKRKGKKSSSKKKSSKPLKTDVSNRITEVIDTPEHEDDAKDVENFLSEIPAVETVEAESNEKSSKDPVPSRKTSDNERVDISLPSPSGSLADEICSKAGGGKKKKDPIQKDETASDVDSGKESDTNLKDEATASKSKLNKHANKKASSDQEDSVPDATDDTNKEDDNMDELDGNSAQGLAQEAEVGISQRDDKKKREQAKPTPAKSRRITPAKEEKKKTGARPKSTLKVAKDESDVEEKLRSSSKRKHQIEEKAPKTKVYGRELVDAKVKVWWPDDNKFYEGVVDSFDSAKKKHTVLYEDGDIEVLNLEEEEWQLINHSEEHASDGDSPDESADEMPKGKNAKTSADIDATRGKTLSSAKKSGASSSKSKATPKSGSKQKHTSKIAGKSEDSSKKVGKSEAGMTGKSTKSSKSGNKLIDDAPNSSKKSKDDDDVVKPKSSSKSKQEASIGALKSKGKTPKNVGKSSRLTSSDESEDESLEPERTPEKPKGKFQSAPKSKQETSIGALKSKGKTPKSVGKSSASTNSDESEDESLEPERSPEKPKEKFRSAPKSQKSSKKRKRSS